MDGFGAPGLDRDHLVVGGERVEELEPCGARHLAHREAHRLELHSLVGREGVFVFGEEAHFAREHAIVDGRLDVEDVEVLVNELAQTVDLARQLRAGRVHVAVGVADGLRLVVRAQTLVVAEADGDGLVAAVHRHKVVVEVDEEVALGGAAVDAQRLFVARLAQRDEAVGLFGVVVVEAFGVEGIEDAFADHPLDLVGGHSPVERDGDDEMNVLDAVPVHHVDEDFERRLTNVRSLHRRQRHAQIVNRNRHLHARLQLREERVAVVRVIERVANRRLAVGQAFDRLVRVDDARPDRQIFQNKIHARGDDARRAVAVDVDHGFVNFSS